jgi:hypothetical protein
MFQNRITGFVPNFGGPSFPNPAMPAAQSERSAASALVSVQMIDIYQAARNRAIEDHELDKLFNPDFYDYQI